MTSVENNFDGVPGFIGGGDALNTAEQLRLLNWNTFRGQEGFLTSVAGRCETLFTPGEGVRILPGPFVVNSRYPGCEMEAYINRLRVNQIVETTTVPPGGGRRDLVIVRIRDPYPEGGQGQDPIPPTDEGKRFGPYCFGEVVEDVPPGTFCLEQLGIARNERGYTALASARLDRPGNTGTVTNDMIKRVNIVCNPLTGIEIPAEVLANIENNISGIISDIAGLKAMKVPVPSSVNDVLQCTPDGNNNINWNQYAFKRFPKEAAGFVNVPTWGNWMSVHMIIASALQTHNGANSEINGNARFRLGGVESQNIHLKHENLGISGQDSNRVHIIANAEFQIANADKGKKVNWELVGQSYQTGARGLLSADAATSIYYAFQFKEKPDAVAV